jgi:hypothetical protein
MQQRVLTLGQVKAKQLTQQLELAMKRMIDYASSDKQSTAA